MHLKSFVSSRDNAVAFCCD